ncbi:helix-turn-helix transcriptional regulator [Bradyrhizobium acaciae]|uniref:helix-turn-helix transcriptional regulator n=1 Tax=Bradyrhizobium acaciae TaxID=2683706 RepID=UPI001E3D1C17|nr:LuxR family transcriptional regulator [Bradyrhizobium acaciae]MCC8977276.1 LuxR family transcriptional regulator [Bradyrhizobium acaciae]
MKAPERLLEEFADAIHTAEDASGFERVATRVTEQLGFRWFAYLDVASGKPAIISSYPRSWTRRYAEHDYQRLDPVIRRASRENKLFDWGSAAPDRTASQPERHFFDEARTFGIKAGLTVPIRGGFGRTVAFTLAMDERSPSIEHPEQNLLEVIQLIAFYFHAHLSARTRGHPECSNPDILTQRERQCLSWSAQGKTMSDIAVLVGISPRTVSFHLENARAKLGASSIAQCVAEALRRGLLS